MSEMAHRTHRAVHGVRARNMTEWRTLRRRGVACLQPLSSFTVGHVERLDAVLRAASVFIECAQTADPPTSLDEAMLRLCETVAEAKISDEDIDALLERMGRDQDADGVAR